MRARRAALAALFTLLPLSSLARVVRDDAGDAVEVPAAPCRIVSLAPGTTAMLYAAGAGHCLVGTIAHSSEPAAAAAVKVVGDAETLDFEQLLALRPTVVLVAVDVVQRVRIDRLRALGLPVYQVHVTKLAGMPESLRRLGALTGTPELAGRAAAALDTDLAALARRYRARPALTVLYQIWDKPIYTIGGRHVISDALALCGASNVFGDLTTAAPAVTRESAVLRDPDVILVSAPPGYGDEWLAEWRKYPALKAVRGGHLIKYTDERIDRMGPSVIAATAGLCEVIDRERRPSSQPGR
jgi:iron complex transport system substrate-binding protein